MTGHAQAPANPADGDTFACECGTAYEYVDLGDGQPGEWVEIPPDAVNRHTPNPTQTLAAPTPHGDNGQTAAPSGGHNTEDRDTDLSPPPRTADHPEPRATRPGLTPSHG